MTEAEQRIRRLERLLNEALIRGWIPADHRGRFWRALHPADPEEQGDG